MISPVDYPLYRRVITSNARFNQLKAMHAPDIVLNNERRILQQAVRALGDLQLSHPEATLARAA